MYLKQTTFLRYIYVRCCSCSVCTVCATCHVISHVKYVLYPYIIYYYYHHHHHHICLLSHAFSLQNLSCTNGDPHLSGFTFHIAALSPLCVTFQLQLSFVASLLNIFPVWLPNFSSQHYYYYYYYYYYHHHHHHHHLILYVHKSRHINAVSFYTVHTGSLFYSTAYHLSLPVATQPR